MEQEMQPLQTDALYGALRSYIFTIPDLTTYIHGELLPLMDAHRGKAAPLSFTNIISKLYATTESKPG